jgi:hypothetical protein
MDAVHQESQVFLGILRYNEADLDKLQPGTFPLLRGKLNEFSKLESWVGVQCQNCGMWATRPIALEEHVAVCTGIKRSDGPPSFDEGFRLTASGLAARPGRRITPDR